MTEPIRPLLTPVSVVIVSYNTADLLVKCVSAIEPRHEVIVVDNASVDGSPDGVAAARPDAVIIRNPHNVGFGIACNQGIAVAKHALVLLLNSDAQPKPGAISELADVFDDPHVVAAGGRLQFEDGRLQESACGRLTLWAVFCEQTFLERILPWSTWFSPYWKSRRLPKGGEVEQVMGACLMMRPLEKFDERFFLYCEDTELCRRLRRHGKIMYEPKAIFTHALGASSSDNRWRSVAYYNRGKELYFRIHHGPIASLICLGLNRMGAILRILAGGLITAKALTFWRVLLAPVNPYPR